MCGLVREWMVSEFTSSLQEDTRLNGMYTAAENPHRLLAGLSLVTTFLVKTSLASEVP